MIILRERIFCRKSLKGEAICGYCKAFRRIYTKNMPLTNGFNSKRRAIDQKGAQAVFGNFITRSKGASTFYAAASLSSRSRLPSSAI